MDHPGLMVPVTAVVLAVSLLFSTVSCRDEYTEYGRFYRTWSELKKVPDDIPSEAKLVHLDHNDIREVKAYSFSHLYKCYNMRLSDNAIKKIEPAAFSGLQKLTSLDLTNNKISKVKDAMWKGLTSLSMLRLENNVIASLAPGAFSNLESLQSLFLARNKLSEIRPDMWEGLELLETLELDDNRIRMIRPGGFANLPNIYSLKLADNELKHFSQNVFDPVNHPQAMQLIIQGNYLDCDESLCWMKEANLDWLIFHSPDMTREPVECGNENVIWDDVCPA